MWNALLRAIYCRMGWCGGCVVSGTHDGVIWVGWRCATCGKVKHYEPAASFVNNRAVCWDECITGLPCDEPGCPIGRCLKAERAS